MDNVVNAPALLVAIGDKLPEGLIIFMGDQRVDTAEQLIAIKAYVRSKVLKQFGVSGINGQNVTTSPLAFGNDRVITPLKLPNVQTNLAGEQVETVPVFYHRCLPTIRTWFKKCQFNAHITVADVEKMD